ncbi:hypothetical protein SCHPADRAFT_935209 [Schizopora paradoxa]|uniref:DUF6534 domain-containing protein n=1 Tax=Schizopora paradoxa TaxID=27342 RepID=A0A0H2SD88_9AGAM|nr:hypothetical protein SCHPADRAFT_935209 [Schizopora paradoxa]
MVTFADLSIATVLCYYLAKSRKTSFQGTRRLLDSIFRYTLHTGFLATLWSVGTLISYGLKPNSEFDLIFYLALSKIYVNALLASLNARESLREKSRIVANTTCDAVLVYRVPSTALIHVKKGPGDSDISLGRDEVRA